MPSSFFHFVHTRHQLLEDHHRARQVHHGGWDHGKNVRGKSWKSHADPIEIDIEYRLYRLETRGFFNAGLKHGCFAMVH